MKSSFFNIKVANINICNNILDGSKKFSLPFLYTSGIMNLNIKNKFKVKNPGWKIAFIVFYVVLLFVLQASNVFAADDPIAVVNNLSNFVFGLIRAVGMIILGFGIVQVGMSLKSHDPTQRANGIMTLAGGIVITFAKEILSLITGG